MFKVLFLLSTVLVAAKAAPASNEICDIGVVGGKDAKVDEFPYMVSLRDSSNRHRCGAFMLNSRTILTAAHCVRRTEPSDIIAVVGSIYLKTGGTKYKISNVTIHPDYNKPHRAANDIAVLITSEPITTSSSVGFIALPTSTTGAGVNVTLSGWGRLSSSGKIPNTLQKIYLLTISDEQCNKTSAGPVDGTNICTLTKVGEGACYGDSGSPLAIGNVAVGIVSRGVPCAEGYPDIYVRVSSYVPWIKKNMP